MTAPTTTLELTPMRIRTLLRALEDMGMGDVELSLVRDLRQAAFDINGAQLGQTDRPVGLAYALGDAAIAIGRAHSQIPTIVAEFSMKELGCLLEWHNYMYDMMIDVGYDVSVEDSALHVRITKLHADLRPVVLSAMDRVDTGRITGSNMREIRRRLKE